MASSRLSLLACLVFSLCVLVFSHESRYESRSSRREWDEVELDIADDVTAASLEDHRSKSPYGAVSDMHGVLSQVLDRRASNFLPTPFDSMGNNFTQSTCHRFFVGFLSNSTFRSCYPLSMLLQNSETFFVASSSAATLNPVVEASCAADLTSCSSFLSGLATELTSDNNCGQDFSLGNPDVVKANTALIAYEPIYRAACLRDPATQQFCFTEAVVNSTNVADNWIYFLPIGLPLPGSSRPTCNVCVQASMKIFSTYAQINGQPLAETYLPAAQEIDVTCGPNFVNSNVHVGSISASTSMFDESTRIRLILTLLVALTWGIS